MIVAMLNASSSSDSWQLCERSQEAIWVAEALSSQIEQLRCTLDHRSLFSAAFNRKYARKIEVLDHVREGFLELSRDLHAAESEVVKNGKVT